MFPSSRKVNATDEPGFLWGGGCRVNFIGVTQHLKRMRIRITLMRNRIQFFQFNAAPDPTFHFNPYPALQQFDSILSPMPPL